MPVVLSHPHAHEWPLTGQRPLNRVILSLLLKEGSSPEDKGKAPCLWHHFKPAVGNFLFIPQKPTCRVDPQKI